MKKQNTQTSGEYLDYTVVRCLKFQKGKHPRPFAWMSQSECSYAKGIPGHLCTILLPKRICGDEHRFHEKKISVVCPKQRKNN